MHFKNIFHSDEGITLLIIGKDTRVMSFRADMIHLFVDEVIIQCILKQKDPKSTSFSLSNVDIY